MILLAPCCSKDGLQYGVCDCDQQRCDERYFYVFNLKIFEQLVVNPYQKGIDDDQKGLQSGGDKWQSEQFKNKSNRYVDQPLNDSDHDGCSSGLCYRAIAQPDPQGAN